MSCSRFAIYFIPTDGPWADFRVACLGWDIVTGRQPARLGIAGLRDIKMTP
ncbi:MAG: hypothetical protein AAF340_03950 [Pseudomonadota bacterium]